MSVTTVPADNAIPAPEDSNPITQTDTTDTTDTTTHKVETTEGHKIHATVTVDTHEIFNGDFDNRVRSLVSDEIKAEDAERQRKEDTRANRRNRNRLYTLLAAILIGFGVVWTLPHLGHIGQDMAPYSFVITVLFDTFLTIYALIRHY